MVASMELVAVRIGKAFGGTKRPLYRRLLLFAILLASASGIARPQTQLATVFGTITDPSGAVIPVARITLLNQNTGFKREVLTGLTGRYHLAGLPAGNY